MKAVTAKNISKITTNTIIHIFLFFFEKKIRIYFQLLIKKNLRILSINVRMRFISYIHTKIQIYISLYNISQYLVWNILPSKISKPPVPLMTKKYQT
jgi:hypothetical protein